MANALKRAAGVLVGAAAATAAVTAVYAIAFERRAFQLRFEELPILPAGSRPIAILHLADIHMAPWQRGKIEWIQGLRDLEPDFIVNTGDSLDHRDGMRALAEALAPFAGIPGAFVHGSHDYHASTFKNPLRYLGAPALGPDPDNAPAHDTPMLERIYESYGWTNLNNSAAEFTIRDTNMHVIGTNDEHIELADLDATAREQELLETKPDVTLGLTHAPYTRILDGLIELGADALMAGHTHGGQVRIPGGPALVTNCDLPVEHADGLTTWHGGGRDVPLEVSAGIGTSVLAPFRLGTPPEAVLITLTAAR